MNARRRVFLTFVLLLTPTVLAVPCSAQVNLEQQPSLLLLATSERSLQESLDNAASKGYRVLLTSHECKGMLLWLERVATPPDIYEYKVLKTVRVRTMEKELNEAGKLGFRLMPRSSMVGVRPYLDVDEFVAVMERPPKFIKHFEYRLGLTVKPNQLSKAQADGYVPVAIVGDVAFVERELDGQQPVLGDNPNRRYLMIDALRMATMQKELDRAAAEGVRLVAASSVAGYLYVWLERVFQSPDKRVYQILTFAPKWKKDERGTSLPGSRGLFVPDVGEIEKELMEAGQKGFHIMAGAVIRRGLEAVILLGCAPKAEKRFEFKVLQMLTPRELEEEVKKLKAKGYGLAGLFNRVIEPGSGGVYIELTALMEREAPEL